MNKSTNITLFIVLLLLAIAASITGFFLIVNSKATEIDIRNTIESKRTKKAEILKERCVKNIEIFDLRGSVTADLENIRFFSPSVPNYTEDGEANFKLLFYKMSGAILSCEGYKLQRFCAGQGCALKGFTFELKSTPPVVLN